LRRQLRDRRALIETGEGRASSGAKRYLVGQTRRDTALSVVGQLVAPYIDLR
jgi:hypothetical protein